MATFLSGVQDLAIECGLASSPTSVLNQTGEFGLLVKWYKDSWLQIQNKNRGMWRWMRHEFSLNTVASTESYAYTDCTDLTDSVAISRFKRWRIDVDDSPSTIYLNSAGEGTETLLPFMPWDYYKLVYKFGTEETGQPTFISVNPQDKIYLAHIPDDVYVVKGDYYRSPQILAADDDVPEMPSHFHDLIVYEAMKKYGFFESAQEVITRGDIESSRMMADLESEQLEEWSMAGSLI